MMGIMIESVVIAFVIGGIIGAVTALHLTNLNKSPVRIENEQQRQNKR